MPTAVILPSPACSEWQQQVGQIRQGGGRRQTKGAGELPLPRIGKAALCLAVWRLSGWLAGGLLWCCICQACCSPLPLALACTFAAPTATASLATCWCGSNTAVAGTASLIGGLESYGQQKRAHTSSGGGEEGEDAGAADASPEQPPQKRVQLGGEGEAGLAIPAPAAVGQLGV